MFMEVNEEKAFEKLLQAMSYMCLEKFCEKMPVKDGWLDDSNDELEKFLVNRLENRINKIVNDKSEDKDEDLIDIVNYAAMIWNLN